MPITKEMLREVMADVARKGWANKTPEEREQWKARIKKSLQKAWKKGKFSKRKKRRKQATG